jgi:hypothetical protein
MEEGGIIRMANEKQKFTPYGVYRCGYNLDRLEWAIATIENPTELARFLEPFRIYEQVYPFEDIGREAKLSHDMLSNYGEPQVSEKTKNRLRDAKTRWSAVIVERLQDFYLVSPHSTIDPKKLLEGINGLLAPQQLSLLEQIEVLDLNEACLCILVASATAAEHMALRAAESLLRRWYEHKTGNKLGHATWGVVLDKLTKEYPENNRPKEIILLGYLKQRRDEVAHPERVSKVTDAEVTLMNVCGLIAGIEPVLSQLALSPTPDSQLAIPQRQGAKSEGEGLGGIKESNNGERK